MALITCPDCEQQVSSLASSCPKCGYPIAEYVKKMQKEKEAADKLSSIQTEIDRLEAKIKKVDFKIPEPRARVCVRCGETFSPDMEVKCKCPEVWHNHPGIEVDYPHAQAWSIPAAKWIHINCVIPMNIGDTECQEYKDNAEHVLEEKDMILELEAAFAHKNLDSIPTWTPEPPDPFYYGLTKRPPANEMPIGKIEKRVNELKPPVPKCPICGSTNLSKITATRKAAKIAVFGIFGMGDNGKTWKCNNCGSKF